MEKQKIIHVAVIAAVLLLVVGVWSMKNADGKASTVTESTASSTTDTPADTTTADAAPTDESGLPFVVTEGYDVAALAENGLPMLLDFGSEGCPPCRAMYPDLEQFHDEMQGKAVVQFVDVWENPDAVGDFPIQVIPTQAFFNADGTPYQPSEAMQDSYDFEQYTDDSGALQYTLHVGMLTLDEMHAILAELGAAA